MADDVEFMDKSQLKAEVRRLRLLLGDTKNLIQVWVDQQGHNRCWYYPDIFRTLATFFGIKASHEPALPPREEFEKGCQWYQKEEYDGLSV